VIGIQTVFKFGDYPWIPAITTVSDPYLYKCLVEERDVFCILAKVNLIAIRLEMPPETPSSHHLSSAEGLGRWQ